MWLLIACAGNATTDTASKPATPDFATIEADILRPSCGFSVCHGTGTGGLTLTGEGDHVRLIDVESVGQPGSILVLPGDSANSYLLHKMEGAAGIVGDPMPAPNGSDSDVVAQLRAWIDAGALP